MSGNQIALRAQGILTAWYDGNLVPSCVHFEGQTAV